MHACMHAERAERASEGKASFDNYSWTAYIMKHATWPLAGWREKTHCRYRHHKPAHRATRAAATEAAAAAPLPAQFVS